MKTPSNNRDEDNPIEDCDCVFSTTVEDIKQTGLDSRNDTIRPAGVTTDEDIKTTRVNEFASHYSTRQLNQR